MGRGGEHQGDRRGGDPGRGDVLSQDGGPGGAQKCPILDKH